MFEGPLLWFVNRGTGFALLGVLTLTVVLGVLSTEQRAGGRVPGFVVQSLHRSTSLLGVTLLAAHVGTAVADEFVAISWWDALLPAGSSYEPLWLGLGALSLDVLLAVVLTSLVRARMRYTAWRAVHVLAYLAWAAGLVHGLGIGTDTGERWAQAGYFASFVLVVCAALVRLDSLRTPARTERTEVH